MFEKDAAQQIQVLIAEYNRNLLHKLSEICDFPKDSNSQTIDQVITGLTANVILRLSGELKSRYLSYEKVLWLTDVTYRLVDGEMVRLSCDEKLIKQVETDNEDYLKYLFSYSDKRDFSYAKDQFEKIAEILLKKLNVNFRNGFDRKHLSLLLENEYLRAEKAVRKAKIGDCEMLWQKICYGF